MIKIDTEELFNEAKSKHLKNLEDIRAFIFGDESNQPQVTYMPKIAEFDKLYKEVKDWVETSCFEGDEE